MGSHLHGSRMRLAGDRVEREMLSCQSQTTGDKNRFREIVLCARGSIMAMTVKVLDNMFRAEDCQPAIELAGLPQDSNRTLYAP